MIRELPIVPIINDVVISMEVEGIDFINFETGTGDQIVTELIKDDQSKTKKAKKYPLFALYTPITIQKKGENYGLVRIPKLTIADLSSLNTLVLNRYGIGKPMARLYACYVEFLTKLCQNQYVNNNEPNSVEHTLIEAPGIANIPETTDFVDCLILKDLEFYITQQSKC